MAGLEKQAMNSFSARLSPSSFCFESGKVSQDVQGLNLKKKTFR